MFVTVILLAFQLFFKNILKYFLYIDTLKKITKKIKILKNSAVLNGHLDDFQFFLFFFCYLFSASDLTGTSLPRISLLTATTMIRWLNRVHCNNNKKKLNKKT